MYRLLINVILQNNICEQNFTLVNQECRCLLNIKFQNFCINNCNELGLSFDVKQNTCSSCESAYINGTESFCSDIRLKSISFNYNCGKFMKPNPQDVSTCICLDKSFELETSNSCKCISGTYFNTYYEGCMKCTGGLTIDGANTYCICTNSTQYYSHRQQTCFNCPNFSSKVSSTNQCQCNTIYQYFDANAQSCIACPSGSVSSSQYNSCVCSNSSQVITKNGCQICVGGSKIQDNYCYCTSTLNFWSDNNTCNTCLDSYSSSSLRQQAKYLCICQTFNNYQLGSACTACPVGSYPSADKQSCLCTADNTYYETTTKTCIPCQNNSYVSNNKCYCNINSYIKTPGAVPVCVQCPSGATSNDMQTSCKCLNISQTYSQAKNKCSPICLSSENLDDVSNTCKCKPDYINVSSQCFQCPGGTSVSTDQSYCVCSYGQFFNTTSMACQTCPMGATASNNICSCPLNSFLKSDRCIPCPAGGTSTPPNIVCVCNPGTFIISLEICKVCPANSVMDGVTFECICNGNAYLSNGVCIPCPADASNNPAKTSCVCSNSQARFDALSNTCVVCPSGANLDANQKCVCSAPNSIVQNNVCTPCSANSHPAADLSSCVCDANFIDYLGTCKECPSGSTPINYQTICSCPAKNIFDYQTMACQSCPAGATVEYNECKCPVNNFISSNACTPCPSGATSSAPYSTCICPNSGNFVLNPPQCITCPASSVLNTTSKICVCSGNLYMKSGSCVSCPMDAAPNSTKTSCVCNTNTFRFDSVSNSCVACPTNAFPDSNQKCICQAANNYVLNNVCTPCTANSKPTIDQTSCTCDSIYINVSGVCKQCPSGSGPVAGQLLCTCPQNNQIFDTHNMECITCPAFATVVSNQCVCPNNFYVKLGVCVTCPPHATSVAPYSTCICPNSETFVPSLGICKTCPLDSTINLVTGVCTCNGNRFMKEGVCVACPSDSVNNADKTSCTCNLNNYRFDSASAKCLACPFGAFPDSNQVCVCQTTNSFVLNDVCTPCPAASSPSSDLASCICIFSTQFFKVDQKACLPCPAGGTASSAGNSCICGSNQYVVNNTCTTCVGQAALKEDKSTCVCTLNTQYFSPVDNVCLNCPSGATTSPGGVCLCPNANDFMTPAACVPCPMYTSPSSDRTYCICSWNAYFDRDSVSCISCWTHSTVSNNVCVCDSGYFKSASKCAACPIGSQVTGDGLSCSCSNGLGFDPLRVLCYSCPAGTSLSQNACLCSGSQYYFSGSCLSCPSGASLKTDKSSCACTDASKFFDAKSNSCRSCPDSSSSNGNGQCLCPGDFFLRNEMCIKCPAGTQPNSLKTSCVCVDNQVFNSSSLTCSECSSNMTVFNDRCVCDFGFQQIGSVCSMCPTSSLPSFSTIQSCTCIVPQFMSEDKTTCQVDDLAVKCSKFIIRRGTKIQYCLDGKTFNNYELDKNIYFDKFEGLHASVFYSVQKMKNVKLNIKSHFNDFITQISLSHYMNASIVSCNISIQAKGNEGSALALSGQVSLNSCQIHFKLDGMVNGLVYNAETIVMNKSSILVECSTPEYYNSKLLADTASSIRIFDSRLIGVNIKYPFSACPVAIITRSCLSGLGECQSTCTGVGECS
ncbi:Conserved_hypothetical protein [Hexamita inflata]|uniref:Uncharacterized protein n=1 Tax=Hexamita inflata TaxID=28002 RepID=A0ABP1H901_9EUKA